MQAPLSLQHIEWANCCNLPAGRPPRQASFLLCAFCVCEMAGHFLLPFRHPLPLSGVCRLVLGFVDQPVLVELELIIVTDVIAIPQSLLFATAPGWALTRVPFCHLRALLSKHLSTALYSRPLSLLYSAKSRASTLISHIAGRLHFDCHHLP